MESSLRSRSYKLCNSLIYFCILRFSGQYRRTCFRVFLIFSLWPCFKTNVFILKLKLSLFSVSLFLRIPGWNYISWNSVLQIVDYVDISRNLNFRIRDKMRKNFFSQTCFLWIFLLAKTSCLNVQCHHLFCLGHIYLSVCRGYLLHPLVSNNSPFLCPPCAFHLVVIFHVVDIF